MKTMDCYEALCDVLGSGGSAAILGVGDVAAPGHDRGSCRFYFIEEQVGDTRGFDLDHALECVYATPGAHLAFVNMATDHVVFQLGGKGLGGLAEVLQAVEAWILAHPIDGGLPIEVFLPVAENRPPASADDYDMPF